MRLNNFQSFWNFFQRSFSVVISCWSQRAGFPSRNEDLLPYWLMASVRRKRWKSMGAVWIPGDLWLDASDAFPWTPWWALINKSESQWVDRERFEPAMNCVSILHIHTLHLYRWIFEHTAACTVREKIIWSPADFVRLPTDKEMISL